MEDLLNVYSPTRRAFLRQTEQDLAEQERRDLNERTTLIIDETYQLDLFGGEPELVREQIVGKEVKPR